MQRDKLGGTREGGRKGGRKGRTVSSSEAQAKMDSSCGCQAMEVMGPGEGGREGGIKG